LPNDTIDLNDEQKDLLGQVIESLEEDEDVDAIYHNGA
jgi:transcriptional/translational regulatory protein YebC/TACO1